MKQASETVILLLIVLVAIGKSQLPCMKLSTFTPTTPITTANPINLTCRLDPEIAQDQEDTPVWKWLKLSPDGRSIERMLGSGNISAQNYSILHLPMECDSGGIYQALYSDNMDNSTCLFGCYFFIRVKEVRRQALLAAFSVYPNVTAGAIPSSPSDGPMETTLHGKEGSMQVIGTCINRFILRSSCEADVGGIWYRNGEEFNPQDDMESYSQATLGPLEIRNLTNESIGYYVCMTTLDRLGSYQTSSVNVVLVPSSLPSSSEETTTSTTTQVEATDNLEGVLKGWHYGLLIGVASLVIIMSLMTGVLWMSYLTVKKRKETKKNGRSRKGYRKTPDSSLSRKGVTASEAVKYSRAQRTKSLIEEIKMVENAEVDTVDYPGPPQIPFSSILFEELLHKGAFKVVHHGIVNEPKLSMLSLPVTVKRLRDETSELGYDELMSEAYLLRAFQEKVGLHPNIVTMLGVTTQGGPTCLLLEFMINGTIDNFLDCLMEGPIPDWYIEFTRETLRGAYHKHVSGDLMNIILQVADGMNYLTNHGFIHRDLSTRNILIGERLNVKISNPGMHHEGYYYVVSERKHFLQDMAPECLWEKKYSVFSDIWSFGILVYRIVTLNSLPYPNMVVSKLHDCIAGGERPQLLNSFSNELYFLLQRCWQFVPTERPPFSTILGELEHLQEKPTRHILLKATKDFSIPGYISSNGQVFLHALPPYALQEDPPHKGARHRSSGTIRSLISSIDDTVYTRETAETMLDFTQSENENDNYNNYEKYLKGDLTIPLAAVGPHKAEKRQNYETDTSIDTSTKALSASKGSSGSAKKKKRKALSAGSREKSEGRRKKEETSLTNTFDREKDLNSSDAPSITDDDKGGGITSDLSGSDKQGSTENLVRL